MFGQQSGQFGSTGFGNTQTSAFSTPASGGFGTPSAFGAATPSTNLFGSTANTNTGTSLFGQNKGFGQTAPTNTGFSFGNTSNVFGTNTSTASSTGTSLFGTPAASTSFGGFGANKSTFGTGTTGGLFGQPTSSSGSLFGQSTNTQSTGIFGATAGAGGLFGASQQTGTTVKFEAPNATDTMVKNGTTQQVNTRHQVISAMEQYKSKSMEELRIEDYTANRKGGTSTGILGIGLTPQANKTAGGLFGQATTTTGFSFGTQSKPLFGGTTTGFGATSSSSGGLFGQTNTATQQQQGGLFGQTKPAFGQTTQSSSLFGNTGGTSLFGQTAQQKPGGLFGQTTTTQTTPLFGGTTNTFGTSTTGFGGFGQQNTGGTGLFNKPTGFGTSTSGSGLSFGNTAAGGLFGNQAKPGGLSLGGTTGFGTSTDGSLFGNKATTGFGTTLGTGSTFGNTLGSTFGSGNTGSSLFGNTNKATGFGTTFGNTGLGGGFNSTGLAGGGTNTQLGGLSAQQTAQSQLHLINLLNSPYGDNPLFRNKLIDKDDKDSTKKPSSFAGQKPLNIPSHYKMSAKQSPSAKPKPHFASKSWKTKLFEGLEEEDPTLSSATFVPRRSMKKLVIKKKPQSEENEVNDSSLFGKTMNVDSDLIERTSVYPQTAEDQSGREERDQRDPGLRSPVSAGQTPSSTSKARSSPAGVLFSTNDPHNRSREDGDPDCTVSDLNPSSGGTRPTRKSLEEAPSQSEPSTQPPLRLQESTSDLDQSSFTEAPPLEGESDTHPAGMVLRRPGYYCIPPLAELATIAADDGRCPVENFTVGREGYGSVFFQGVTDVSGLNLDEIVFFRRKEITIYPDDNQKPPEGEGLNKRAEVTLDRTWPVDKSTREPIRDLARLSSLRYEEKLERATSKLGAKFIEYRPDTGSWVFEVPHFSKYSLQDVDEDDGDVALPPMDQRQDPPKIVKKVPFQERQLQQPNVERDTLLGRAAAPIQKMMDHQESIGRAPEKVQEKTYRGLGGHPEQAGFLFSGQVSQPSEGDTVMEAFEPQQQENGLEQPGQEEGGFDDEMDEAAPPAQQQQRLAETLGISTHRMQVMKASFFQGEEGAMETGGKAHGSFLQRPDTSVHSVNHSFHEAAGQLNQSAYLAPPALNQSRGFLLSKGVRGTPDPGYELDDRPAAKRRPQGAGFFASPKTSGMLMSSFNYPNQRRAETSLTEQPQATARVVGARPTQRQVPLTRSLLNQKARYMADFGCVRERAFRVGWGDNWNLVHSGRPIGQQYAKGIKQESVSFTLLPAKAPSRPTGEPAPFSLSLENVHVASHIQSGDKSTRALHINLLKVSLGHSLGAEERGCPTFAPSRGVGALHDYASMVRRDLDQRLSHDLSSLQHSCQVFELMVSLWGELADRNQDEDDEEDIDKSSYEYQRLRRTAFSKWLANTAAEDVQREVQDSKFKDLGNIEAVFSLLTGHQISEACQVAQQSGDHRLALLLAQAGCTREARQLVEAQLIDWRELEADRFIAPEYLKVYALLAGILVWPSSQGEINTCQDLDWKRALALHLWHHCSPTASVAEALSEYENGFTGESSSGYYCKRPAPPYMERNPSMFADESSQGVLDTCYHLLKLYSDRSYPMERVLAPPTHSAHHLDYRISWHVLQSLQALGYTHISEKHATHLHTSYAAQLESIGLWHWALFVLLHIADINRREMAVRGILQRHASLVNTAENKSIERFLIGNLHIQPAWIHEAKALRALYEDKPHDRAYHLREAGSWNECHRVIMTHLAADCIINENYGYLRSFLDVLGLEENCRLIQDWNTNGEVYLDFINIRERIFDLEQGEPSVSELERLHPDITSLCQRVGSVACPTAKDRLSVAEMSKRTANMLKIVLNLQHASSESSMDQEGKDPTPVRTHLLGQHINKLPLPGDYSLQEIQELARSSLIELT